MKGKTTEYYSEAKGNSVHVWVCPSARWEIWAITGIL